MKNASACIGQKTSNGYIVPSAGQWVWIGTIPARKLGLPDNTAYMNLGTHQVSK